MSRHQYRRPAFAGHSLGWDDRARELERLVQAHGGACCPCPAKGIRHRGFYHVCCLGYRRQRDEHQPVADFGATLFSDVQR